MGERVRSGIFRFRYDFGASRVLEGRRKIAGRRKPPDQGPHHHFAALEGRRIRPAGAHEGWDGCRVRGCHPRLMSGTPPGCVPTITPDDFSAGGESTPSAYGLRHRLVSESVGWRITWSHAQDDIEAGFEFTNARRVDWGEIYQDGVTLGGVSDPAKDVVAFIQWMLAYVTLSGEQMTAAPADLAVNVRSAARVGHGFDGPEIVFAG
jgi:hypothetical protein